MLSLDSVPPAEALAEILAMPHVTRAWMVKLPPAGEMPAVAGRVRTPLIIVVKFAEIIDFLFSAILPSVLHLTLEERTANGGHV